MEADDDADDNHNGDDRDVMIRMRIFYSEMMTLIIIIMVMTRMIIFYSE